jgi:carbamoyl-phosphate synthase large subunit
MNIQYAIHNDTVYILEANPRASRTVPLVSKVCGISMARIATQLMLGKKLNDLNIETKSIPHYGVKEAVFPFYFYPEVDPVLGPEMKSTGEVLGMAESFGMAFYKVQDAAQSCLPLTGTVLITVADKDKPGVIDVARRFTDLGFTIMATSGTRDFLAEHGFTTELVSKMRERRPDVGDKIKNGDIQLVINTPRGKASKVDDSYIRKAAIRHKIPYITTVAAALAAAKGIDAYKAQPAGVKSLQQYHADIQ